jgi:hypothetical protein
VTPNQKFVRSLYWRGNSLSIQHRKIKTLAAVILCLGMAGQEGLPPGSVRERIPGAILDDPTMRQLGALPAGNCAASTGSRIIRLGLADNFAPGPAEPLFISPTANAVWGTRLAPFDANPQDRVFAASINLGQCKLCSGERSLNVELKVRRRAGAAASDKAFLHFSNGTANPSGLSPAAAVKEIWQGDPPSTTTKTITLQVPLAQANQYIFLSPMAYLDVAVQHNTSVDYVQFRW